MGFSLSKCSVRGHRSLNRADASEAVTTPQHGVPIRARVNLQELRRRQELWRR